MRLRGSIIGGIAVAVIAVAVGGVLYAIDRQMEARYGPVHRFPGSGDSFLKEDRAIAIARELMKRDGYPEPAWKLVEDSRSKAPDGRIDRYLARNAHNPNRGTIGFYCDHSPTPTRNVILEFREGEITARGHLGK